MLMIEWNTMLVLSTLLVLATISLLWLIFVVDRSHWAENPAFVDALCTFIGLYQFGKRGSRGRLVGHLSVTWFLDLYLTKWHNWIHFPGPVQNSLLGAVILTQWFQAIGTLSVTVGTSITLMFTILIALLALTEILMHIIGLVEFQVASKMEPRLMNQCVRLLEDEFLANTNLQSSTATTAAMLINQEKSSES